MAIRVLLIAEAANPEWTSVPLEGWSHSQALARLTEAHVVTHLRNRESFLRSGLTEGREFTAINSDAVARPLLKISRLMGGGAGKGWTTIAAFNAFSYYYFEHLVWESFRDRLSAGDFDVVHRLTPLSPTAASILAGRCRRLGVPFIVGPLNGGLPWPPGYGHVIRQEREWLSHFRNLHKRMPSYRSMRRDSSAMIAGSLNVLEQLAAYGDKVVYVPENGIESRRFTLRRSRTAGKPVRGVFVGRLVPYKGADMLLEGAADLIRQGDLTIDLVGDGPQRGELEGMVGRLGLTGGVRFHGWVDHTKLQELLIEFDLFTFPSIREFGGAAVLEAMAVGLAPVVVGYGGPAELATERTGWLLEMGTRDEIISQLREVLGRIAADPAQIDQRSAGAYHRAHSLFTWDAKARQVLEVYRWVLGQRSTKPEIPAPFPDEPWDVV